MPMPTAESSRTRLSAEQAAYQGKEWAEVQADGERLFWLEFDASRGCSRVLSKHRDSPVQILTTDEYSVRSRVHEYGGGSYCITSNALVFVNEWDQGLYRQSLSDPDDLSLLFCSGGYRFGDLQFDPLRQRIIAVEEQHQGGKVTNRIVSIGLDNPVTRAQPGCRKVLVQGDDFYASPRLSSCGQQLAWISWNHPHQPWISSCLWLGRLGQQGTPQGQNIITSGQYGGQDESVLQPEFGPDGTLYFLSDRSGWWNLYGYLNPSEGYTEALLPKAAEFSRAPWQLGQRAYVVLDRHRIGCSWWSDGLAGIGELHLPSRQLRRLGEWPAIHSLAQQDGDLLAITEPADEPGQLWRWPLATQSDGGLAIQRLDCRYPSLRPGAVTQACHITIPGRSKPPIYGFLYRPAKQRQAEAHDKPPLIIQLHGGPTAQADGRFDPLKQYWLQRGFVMLDLNYRGSSGYGRAYRHSLRGKWGIADAEDVVDAALFCIDQGWVHPDRILVRGNSAGGYTTLQVLSQQSARSLIRAGASLYGISDLERLACETHKFESHYLNWLIGDPQQQQLDYRVRSPIHKPHKFEQPVIFFQGDLDRVVPATQTHRLFNQLDRRGVTVEYYAFQNERHGFRHARNRTSVLERELLFYDKVLGLNLVDDFTLMEPHHVQRKG